MTNEATLPRWFLIVRRDKPGLCEYLRETYVGDGRVEVLVDRRLTTSAEMLADTNSLRTELRGRDLLTAAPGDRRQSQRRQPLAPSQQAFWITEGFFLVRRTPGTPPA